MVRIHKALAKKTKKMVMPGLGELDCDVIFQAEEVGDQGKKKHKSHVTTCTTTNFGSFFSISLISARCLRFFQEAFATPNQFTSYIGLITFERGNFFIELLFLHLGLATYCLLHHRQHFGGGWLHSIYSLISLPAR